MPSFEDWDFSSVAWVLDDEIYHAAPPSLHGTGSGDALVKNTSTGALSDGRLVTWARSSSADLLCYITFRNQKADGGAGHRDCYQLRWYRGAAGVTIYRVVDNGYTNIGTKTHNFNHGANTWHKIRVTWWSMLGVLKMRVERWDGEAWVTLGGAADTDWEDAADQFKDAEVNRCGVYYGPNYWFDDLEVWG